MGKIIKEKAFILFIFVVWHFFIGHLAFSIFLSSFSIVFEIHVRYFILRSI